jgi:hypothetical protein
MWRGFARLRWAFALMILAAPTLGAGVASAAVSPALGRWSGTGQGGTVHFVVSRVRGTDVLSDLVEQCSNGSDHVAGDIPWSRNKQGPIRDEAAIGANGRIDDLFRSPHTDRLALDYDVHGRLSGSRGTLTVHDSSDGDQRCVIRNAHVSHTGHATLVDGDYRVSGGEPGTAVELSVFGEGAEVWWDGLFGTPIGGVEDDPALCAEVEATALGVGDAFLGQDGHSFSSDDVAVANAVLLEGHFIGPAHGFGGYVASSYPVCTGTGVLTWTLVRLAPPLGPALPLHEAAPLPSPPPPPPARHRHQERPSRATCSKAIKLLTDYARLYEKVNRRPMPRKLREELDRKRAAGTISSNDLPGSLQREFPGELRGLKLDEIRRRCSARR